MASRSSTSSLITAGDNGRIGITWYGANSLGNDGKWKAYYAFTANARAATPAVKWTQASDHFIHNSNVSQGGLDPSGEGANRNLIDFFQIADDPRDGAAVIAFAGDENDFDGATFYTRQIAGPGMRASVPVTVPTSCPPLKPFRDPEVLDFLADEDSGAPTPDADILNVDFSSQIAGGNLYLTADITLTNVLVAPPPERSYRAYFAVNTVDGLMDAGNEYFIEVTTASGAPQYWLGVKDRRGDGTTHELRTSENIAADQRPTVFVAGAPGRVRLRVNVNRLDYSFVADGTPVNGGSTAPTSGKLVIGLSSRARIATPTATSLVDETRGGSFIVLKTTNNDDDDGPP